jgi:hypothetical protein
MLRTAFFMLHVCYPYRASLLSARLACQVSTMSIAVMLLSDGMGIPVAYLLLSIKM